jgi:hypothetical protein
MPSGNVTLAQARALLPANAAGRRYTEVLTHDSMRLGDDFATW